MARKPVVAGQFYPADRAELERMLKVMVVAKGKKKQVFGALVPHAGYVFSGETAGAVIGSVEVPEYVVLLSTSHHFDYPPCALWTGGAWETPLGDVPMDEALTNSIRDIQGVTPDDRTHLPEHSGEVVVPFIQHAQPDVKMAFLCVTHSCPYATLKKIGAGLAEVIRGFGAPVLIIASSDMSHERGSNALAVVKDHDALAVARMQALDAEGLLRECLRVPVTMCGVRPAALMIEAAKALGATTGELLMQATSADSPHGRGSYVVGYAGMVFY